MAVLEPKLPLDVVSMQTVARDQIRGCIDDWLIDWGASKTIGHAGMVSRKFLREQTGHGFRNVITVLGGGGGGRLAGGAATQWEPNWGWFMVVPGTIKNRVTDALTLTGEAVKFITATPWLELEAAAASGTMRFTGVDASVFAGGEVVARNDGVMYVVGAGGVIAGGKVDLPVSAVETGALGNANPGAKLTLTVPPAGVDALATVLGAGLVLGSDDSAFAKTPRANTTTLTPLYDDKDEELGLSRWLLRWKQEICLGTAQRARTPGPDILTTVTGTSTLPAEPNDDSFTQTVEQ